MLGISAGPLDEPTENSVVEETFRNSPPEAKMSLVTKIVWP